MKTLYVHIGAPKTASTALQFFCVDNIEVLKKKGFCYPLFPQTYPDASRMRAYFLIVKLKNWRGKRSERWEEKVFKEGMEIVHKSFSNYDNVILSDERIWRSMDVERKDLWQKLKKEAEKGGFQIHVIAYLRRQDKFLISLWNQQVKIIKMDLAKCTIEEWLSRVNLKARVQYYEKLERIAAVIGKENITVRRFDDGKFEGGSIYSDFLSTLGLKLTDEYNIKQEIRNIGLYGNTQEIKRVINFLPEMIQDRKTQNFIMERLQECSEISKKNYPCEMLSQEEIKELLDTYEEGNRKIAEEYLHEPGAELFNNTIKDLPKWQKDNPYILDDVIRFAEVTIRWLFRKRCDVMGELKGLEEKFASLLKESGHGIKKTADNFSEADLADQSSEKELPKWQKDNPDSINGLILFAGEVTIRLYQEYRAFNKDLKGLEPQVDGLNPREKGFKTCADNFDVHGYCISGEIGASDDALTEIPKWQEEDSEKADAFVRYMAQTAKQMYQENYKIRQEIDEMKQFAEYAAHPYKRVFRHILGS